jgi:hypothetical protein
MLGQAEGEEQVGAEVLVLMELLEDLGFIMHQLYNLLHNLLVLEEVELEGQEIPLELVEVLEVQGEIQL